MAKRIVRLNVQQLDPGLALPVTAHEGDAGVDLYASQDATITHGGGRIVMPTGIAIALPIGYVGLVVPRSGLALNHGVTLVNTPGVIDSGYRGELKVVMINTDPIDDYVVARGDRIAQLLVHQIESVEWVPVDRLDDFDRGGGFGHSGR